MINNDIDIKALNVNLDLRRSIMHRLMALDRANIKSNMTPDAAGNIILTHHFTSYVNSGIKHSGAVTSMSTLKMENACNSACRNKQQETTKIKKRSEDTKKQKHKPPPPRPRPPHTPPPKTPLSLPSETPAIQREHFSIYSTLENNPPQC